MSTFLLIFGRLCSDVVEYGPLRWYVQACERFGSEPHFDKPPSRGSDRALAPANDGRTFNPYRNQFFRYVTQGLRHHREPQNLTYMNPQRGNATQRRNELSLFIGPFSPRSDLTARHPASTASGNFYKRS